MSHTSSELAPLHFPDDRYIPTQWGIDTALANGVDLSRFRSILIVQNYGVDHGAAGNGVLIVDQHPDLCEFGFICHEMGHGFGLPHSWAGGPDMEYGDGWDVMSFATTTAQFPIAFQGRRGDATVGMNARNIEALGAMPAAARGDRGERLQRVGDTSIRSANRLVKPTAPGREDPAGFHRSQLVLLAARIRSSSIAVLAGIKRPRRTSCE